IGVKHIIADIVHGTLVQSLPVLATMVVGIGIFVLAVHTIGQRPAAVRTFYQPGKYLCCAVLLPSAPVANLLLYLTEHIFGHNRFVGVLHTIPFLFWLEIGRASCRERVWF